MKGKKLSVSGVILIISFLIYIVYVNIMPMFIIHIYYG